MLTKDPRAKLPFVMDWSKWLLAEGDTGDTASWTVPPGLVQGPTPPPSLADGKATIWLSGGTDGTTYAVSCRLVTEGGREDERTLLIKVAERRVAA